MSNKMLINCLVAHHVKQTNKNVKIKMIKLITYYKSLVINVFF